MTALDCKQTAGSLLVWQRDHDHDVASASMLNSVITSARPGRSMPSSAEHLQQHAQAAFERHCLVVQIMVLISYLVIRCRTRPARPAGHPPVHCMVKLQCHTVARFNMQFIT